MTKVRPETVRRSLQLVAAFEGHGDGNAVGDFDGAVLTYGPLGFNLASGGLYGVLRRIVALAPAALPLPLADAVRIDHEAVVGFVRTFILRPDDRARIRPDWQLRFQQLYTTPVAQQAFQEASVGYLRKAEAIARSFGFRTERGFAFALDVAVQNGSIKRAARLLWRDIRVRFAAQADHDEAEEWVRLKSLAYAIAETVRPRWRKDVLSRKLCIALGEGVVHDRKYDLRRDFGIRYDQMWEVAQ